MAQGGDSAVKLELGQKYIQALSNLSEGGNRVILSGNLGCMDEMLDAMDLKI